MILWSFATTWEKVNSRAVAAGSQAQVENVLEMAIQDLLELQAEVVRLGGDPLSAQVRSRCEPIHFRHGSR